MGCCIKSFILCGDGISRACPLFDTFTVSLINTQENTTRKVSMATYNKKEISSIINEQQTQNMMRILLAT